MASVSFVIMAHPKRSEWAEALADEVGCEIVWDEVNHAWDTGKRSLLHGHQSGADYVCVIQDDVILSEGFREVVEDMVQYVGDHPVGLYAGDSTRTQAAAKHDPYPWYAATGPIWGPCLMVPTAHVPAIVSFGDRTYRLPSYDIRVWRFYQRHRIWCYYPYPSLVDHRTGHGSLIRAQGRDRRALAFGSGLGVDWSVEPRILDQMQLHPRVTVTKDGQTRVVRRDTKSWRIAQRAGWVEDQPVIEAVN